MNKLFDRLERKFSNKAIPRLTMLLIGCYVIGYAIMIINPNLLSYMFLDPYYILHGQVWRIITWILVPPSSPDIFTLIMLFFYFSIGTTLERTWGDFRYNAYIFSGLIISVITAFIVYFVTSAILGQNVLIGSVFSTYYICTSILLAFAATFPDARVLLWFIIPIKIKWLGIIYGVLMAYDTVNDIRHFIATNNLGYIVRVICLLASLANFFIFFINSRKRPVKKNIFDSAAFKKATQSSNKSAGMSGRSAGVAGTAQKKAFARHRCTICGRTEISSPELDFRYCSKCDGAHEYCSDHIFTHEHLRETGE